MHTKTVWQQGSNNPDNASHFLTISQWWISLQGQEITWRQRLIAASGSVDELKWEPQRFDESFILPDPQVRGITLYWRKPGASDERNLTPAKLELDHLQQQLYIYPQSQPGVVIRVAIAQAVYQTVQITQPQWQVTGQPPLLVLRDESQRLELRIALTPESLTQLQQQLGLL